MIQIERPFSVFATTTNACNGHTYSWRLYDRPMHHEEAESHARWLNARNKGTTYEARGFYARPDASGGGVMNIARSASRL